MIPDDLKGQCIERMNPYDCEGFVEGEGPMNPLLMLIGEAPGVTEIETGIPFNGRSGEYLTQFLHYLGFKRSDVFITSTVRSRPFKMIETTDKSGNVVIKRPNRAPTKKEQLAHAPLLDYQIEKVNPEIIMTVGNIAYKRLTGETRRLSHIHGQIKERKILRLSSDETFVLSDRIYTIFPTYHPASIFYNRKLLEDIYRDLDHLKRYIMEKDLY